MKHVWSLVLISAALLAGCDEEQHDPIEVRSAAFGQGEQIPSLHTCYGAQLSPPLTFSGVPEETVSMAVVMDVG